MGVLKAPRSLGSLVTSSRPMSGFSLSMPMPMLWYFSSVRFAPTWQAVQFALSVKEVSRPRLALSDMGCALASALAVSYLAANVRIVLDVVRVELLERPQSLVIIKRRRAR